MKTEEDEAFDEIARKQGMWGGGFTAKRQAAMDKINTEFRDEYIKYRTAFPKEYKAPQVQEDRIKYGTSWEKDGERIDPMSVYKEPEQEPVAWITPDGEGFRIRFSPPTNDVPLGWDALYTAPPQREWVGLTDEEIDEGNKQSWVNKQAWESAVWWASEKLKERNHGT